MCQPPSLASPVHLPPRRSTFRRPNHPELDGPYFLGEGEDGHLAVSTRGKEIAALIRNAGDSGVGPGEKIRSAKKNKRCDDEKMRSRKGSRAADEPITEEVSAYICMTTCHHCHKLDFVPATYHNDPSTTHHHHHTTTTNHNGEYSPDVLAKEVTSQNRSPPKIKIGTSCRDGRAPPRAKSLSVSRSIQHGVNYHVPVIVRFLEVGSRWKGATRQNVWLWRTCVAINRKEHGLGRKNDPKPGG
eukprot:318466-Pelagomonas_calceolata.AAC.3